MSDKRKHPRFVINQFVEIDMGRETFINAKGLNLSEGGIMCETDEPCDMYSQIFMMMTLSFGDKERIIKFEGIVVRCDKKGAGWDLGISITSMDAASKKIFGDFLHGKK